jgi:hypothetical protein
MKLPRNLITRRLRPGALAVVTATVVLSTGLLFAQADTALAAATAVPLGTTTSFGVLAGSGITNTGPTTINGDIGTFPTTSISGVSTLTINGTNHGGDAVAQGAKTDLVTAYNAAAGEGPTSPVAADLGGQTLTAGVYNSASSIGLTGALTLDAQGNPNAVFVFQAGSTLTTASASQIFLTNGAQACNVFWQIGSSATLGTGSSFVGTILAEQSITVTTAVTVSGRALAQNGAVTLDSDSITLPACTTSLAVTPTTTTVAGATTSGGSTTKTATVAKTAAQKRAAAAAKRAAAIKKAAATSKPTTTTPAPTTPTVPPGGFASPPLSPPGFTG